MKGGVIYHENGKLFEEGIFENGNLKKGKIYYTNENIWKEDKFVNGKLSGYGKIYYTNGELFEEGIFKDDKLNGDKSKVYYKNGKLFKKGKFVDGNFNGEGKTYHENGKLWKRGTFENNNFKNGNKFYNITIQDGEYEDGYLYSGSAYLRENPEGKTIEELNVEKINKNNKIYTLERNEENPNIRTITFYTTNPKIGLDRNIKIHIDENNIATLQSENGEPIVLTEEEISKIKKFFTNIPKEQLNGFDNYLAILYNNNE